ncbi:MAG: hypothetical protein PHZ02_01370 [Desulfocapsaceae bacterium]|nr:hypothetical protein [Desulfocapsaceae bacterium]
MNFYGKRKLTTILTLYIISEQQPSRLAKPVNENRTYSTGTTIECTGGSDISYYIHINNSDTLIEIPMKDGESIMANSEFLPQYPGQEERKYGEKP